MGNQLSIQLKMAFSFLGCLLLVYSSGAVYANEKKNHRVQDPRYGLVLWHYFQGQHLQALTELMVAEETGGIQGHGDNPQLMQAALQLAYGMVDYSKTGFEELLTDIAPAAGNNNSTQSTKNTAWHYLADIHYQRHEFDKALVALDEMDFSDLIKSPNNKAQQSIADKARLLRFNILIQQSEFVQAEALLVDKSFPDKPISWFNLGNAYSRQADYTKALDAFDHSIQAFEALPEIRQEDLFLADRIHTTAGYACLLSDQPERAIGYFSQVQQQSPDSELAMLGYARAASQLGRYPQALGYFQTLGQQAAYKPAVQESLVSVAAVYEQMQRPGTALREYKQAMLVYQSSLVTLDDEIDQIQSGGLSHLVDDSQPSEFDWLESSNKAVSRPPHEKFSELFSENRFQADVRELKDLMDLHNLVSERTEHLSIIRDVLASRENSRKSQWSRYEDLGLDHKLITYKTELTKSAQLADQSDLENNHLAFISPNQKTLLKRVEDSEQRLEWISRNTADLDKLPKQKNLLRIYRGMLQWQAAQDFSQNYYAYQQQQKEANNEFKALIDNQSRVENLLAANPQSADQELVHIERLDAIERHMTVVDSNLQQKIAEVSAKIRSSMIAQLQSNQHNLRQYLIQAQLASLRIYEESSLVAAKPLEPIQ